MELIGVLTFGEGEYWVCNAEEAWAFLLQVGVWVEVLVGRRMASREDAQRRVPGAVLSWPGWAVHASGAVHAGPHSGVGAVRGWG